MRGRPRKLLFFGGSAVVSHRQKQVLETQEKALVGVELHITGNSGESIRGLTFSSENVCRAERLRAGAPRICTTEFPQQTERLRRACRLRAAVSQTSADEFPPQVDASTGLGSAARHVLLTQ